MSRGCSVTEIQGSWPILKKSAASRQETDPSLNVQLRTSFISNIDSSADVKIIDQVINSSASYMKSLRTHSFIFCDFKKAYNPITQDLVHVLATHVQHSAYIKEIGLFEKI